MKFHRRHYLPNPFTVVTYNIHSCVNFFGRKNPLAIAHVLAEIGPELVALQEVSVLDSDPALSGPSDQWGDQAQWIASQLNMHAYFHAVRTAPGGHFGLALFSRQPLTPVKLGLLPDAGGPAIREPRGAMWYVLETDHGRLNILNTHLALKPQDRQVQIRRLLDDEWLGGLSSDEAVIFCGDLNAGFRSPVYRALLSKYADVQMQIGQRGYPQHTFFSFYPFLRLDHIFISLHLTTLRVRVYQSVEARLASDHLPLCARLKWADSG